MPIGNQPDFAAVLGSAESGSGVKVGDVYRRVAEAGVTVESETFALAELADAVAAARWRAVAVAMRHPGEGERSTH
jgi:hypothetical protein